MMSMDEAYLKKVWKLRKNLQRGFEKELKAFADQVTWPLKSALNEPKEFVTRRTCLRDGPRVSPSPERLKRIEQKT